MHLNFPVHRQDEFIVRCRVPRGRTFGTNGFDHVFEVLGDRDPLVRFRLRRDFEHVREYISFGVVIDDGYAPLLEPLDGAKISLISRHRSSLQLVRRLFAMLSIARIANNRSTGYDKSIGTSKRMCATRPL